MSDVALILKVNHKEWLNNTLEEGPCFKIYYHNNEFLDSVEKRDEWLKNIPDFHPSTEYGYDYGAWRLYPDGLPVVVGPGDYIVIYRDYKYGCFVGVGELKVVDGNIVIGRG